MWIDYSVRIAETADELRRQERAVRGHRAADRVKLLRLLKSGEARSVRQAAATLGYSVRQAQRWWACYAHGGLAALVEVGHPGGSHERITPEAWADLSAQMQAGAIGRLKDAQAYLRERWGIEYCLDGISKLFIRRKTKRKTGRHSKNQFAGTLETHQVRRVFALDEARFGLKVRHRRRWCPFGARPPWIHADQYKWFWLYVAIEPTTGESVALFLPRIDGICFERFLQEFRRAVPDEPIALVLDGSGSHTSQHIRWPIGLQPVPLPRYSPELNPSERWFEELRKSVANRVFDTIADLEAALTETLRCYWDNPAKLIQLTAFPWWREAVQAITSL